MTAKMRAKASQVPKDKKHEGAAPEDVCRHQSCHQQHHRPHTASPVPMSPLPMSALPEDLPMLPMPLAIDGSNEIGAFEWFDLADENDEDE